MHFFSLISVSVLQIIDSIFSEDSLLSLILTLVGSPALLSLLGARLLFNLKEAGSNSLSQGTSCGSKSTVTAMDFSEALQASSGRSEEEAMEIEAIETGGMC